MLIHTIYASAAAAGFSDTDLPLLLDRSRTKNAARGITGMLLYSEGSFFQVIEGEAKPVDELLETLRADPRHGKITVIIRETIAERAFGQWTMGYAAAGETDLATVVGRNDFFDGASCLAHLDDGRARKLLALFGHGRWRSRLDRPAAASPAAR